jgi:hypothetical protein
MGLPLIYDDAFRDTCIEAFEMDQRFKALPLLAYFYLSLVGKGVAFDRWRETWIRQTGKAVLASVEAFVAINRIVQSRSDSDMKEWTMAFILRLLQWEWTDRSKLATLVLDLHFRFNVGQKKALWCLLAVQSTEYKDQVNSVIRHWCRVRHANLVSERAKASPVDLATFVLLVQDIHSTDEPGLKSQSWFQSLVDHLELDMETVDVSLFLQWILTIQSAFGYRALRLLGSFKSLTTRQKHWLIRNQHRLIVTDAKEAVKWLVLKTTSKQHVKQRWIGWNKIKVDLLEQEKKLPVDEPILHSTMNMEMVD